MNRKLFKRISASLISLLMAMLVSVSGFTALTFAEESSEESSQAESIQQSYPSFNTDVGSVNEKYGNVFLSLPTDELSAAGYKPGDIIALKVGDHEMDIPYVNTLYDLKFKTVGMQPHRSGYPVLIINGGNFAETYGIEEGMQVTLDMKEEGGYLNRLSTLDLSGGSNNREDYPDLSDAQFANFRLVTSTGMKDNTLYRTSTPIETIYKRNQYADALLKEHGVQTVINLANTEADLSELAEYDQSYYKTVNHIELGMSSDFGSDDFNGRLSKGLRFMLDNPAPYAINCQAGMDRTGFVCAVLECLTGAAYEEIIEDYMTSFYNAYGVTPGTEANIVFAENTIVSELEYAFDTEKLKTSDMKKGAEDYLVKAGLSEDEVEKLETLLSEVQPEQKTLTKNMISLAGKKYVYSGKAVMPEVTVKDGAATLENNTHYTVKYSDNKKVGMAAVTISGKGEYTGTIKKTFKIIPGSTYFTKVKGESKAVALKWKKQTKQTTGYQIMYSRDKSFKSGCKTIKIKKNTVTAKKLKNLKSKKTCYVKIRAYKKTGGVTYYSAWSKVKKVKVK